MYRWHLQPCDWDSLRADMLTVVCSVATAVASCVGMTIDGLACLSCFCSVNLVCMLCEYMAVTL